MLVSGGSGFMCPEATYGASLITCVLLSSRARLYSWLHAPNSAFVLPFLPPFPSLIGGFGKYWVGKYLHWPGQCDGAWWVVAVRRVAMDTCVPCSRLVSSPGTSAHFIRHHPRAHLLAMSLNMEWDTKYFVRSKIAQSHTINFLSRTIDLQKSAQFSFFPAPCQKACF